MIITVDPYSEHYIGAANFGRYRVLLDGVRVHDAIFADDDAGVVVHYERNSDGGLIIDHSAGTGPELVREELHGVVQIVDKWDQQSDTATPP